MKYKYLISLLLILVVAGCGKKMSPQDIILSDKEIDIKTIELSEPIKYDEKLKKELEEKKLAEKVVDEDLIKQSNFDDLWTNSKFKEIYKLCKEKEVSNCDPYMSTILFQAMVNAENKDEFIKYEDLFLEDLKNQKNETFRSIFNKANYYGRALRDDKFSNDDERFAQDGLKGLQNSLKAISVGEVIYCRNALGIIQAVQSEDNKKLYKKNAELIMSSCKEIAKNLSVNDKLSFDSDMIYWSNRLEGKSEDESLKIASSFEKNEKRKIQEEERRKAEENRRAEERNLESTVKSKLQSNSFKLIVLCDDLYGNGVGMVETALRTFANNPDSFPYMMNAGGFKQYCQVPFSPVTNMEMLKDAEIRFTRINKHYIILNMNGKAWGIEGQ